MQYIWVVKFYLKVCVNGVYSILYTHRKIFVFNIKMFKVFVNCIMYHAPCLSHWCITFKYELISQEHWVVMYTKYTLYIYLHSLAFDVRTKLFTIATVTGILKAITAFCFLFSQWLNHEPIEFVNTTDSSFFKSVLKCHIFCG